MGGKPSTLKKHKVLNWLQTLDQIENNDKNLAKLTFENYGLNDKSTKPLCAALEKNHTLTELILNSNHITGEGAKTILLAANKCHKLTTIRFANNLLANNIEDLCTGIAANQTLRILDLSENNLDYPAIISIAAALKINHSLYKLILAKNNISGTTAKILITNLIHSKQLKALSLAENPIGAKGAHAISDALTVNQNILILDLKRCHISDGAQFLFHALRINRNIIDLNLEENEITIDAINVLADTLVLGSSLMRLNLNNNKLSKTSIKYFVEILKKNSTLVSLELCDNFFDLNDIKFINAALNQNHALTTLSLKMGFIAKDTPFLDNLNFNYNPQIQDEIQQKINQNIHLHNELINAIISGDLKLVKKFFDLGVSFLSVTPDDSNTPLHWAKFYRQNHIAKWLKEEMIMRSLPLQMPNKLGQAAEQLTSIYFIQHNRQYRRYSACSGAFFIHNIADVENTNENNELSCSFDN